jgi:glycosyltransferase involved in cell wall biosynthesis
MRLLLVCDDLHVGGAQRQWAELVLGLRERGVETRVLTVAEEGGFFEQLRDAGVAVRCLGFRGRLDPAGLRRALGEAGGRPDAVIAQQVSGQLVGAAIARRAVAPLVVTEHTPCTPDGGLLPRTGRQRLLTRLVAPRARRTIVVARAQVEPVLALGYRPETVRVIPNGVFPDRLVPARPREQVRRELGVADREFAVLCAAAMRPEKRVDAFVTAVAAARGRAPHLRGFVAGDGRERETVERLAGGSGTTLLGVRSDMADLIAAADAVCLPSEAEALPMSVLEAMALARPVVATDVGGTRDAVVDGETGLLVPAGAPGQLERALVRLAEDPAAAAAMGERGRERQRARFDGRAMVDAYVAEFEAVLA